MKDDQRNAKDKVSDAETKINSDNRMLDSSAEPVVTDDRSVSNDKKMIDSSKQLVINDKQTPTKEPTLRLFDDV